MHRADGIAEKAGDSLGAIQLNFYYFFYYEEKRKRNQEMFSLSEDHRTLEQIRIMQFSLETKILWIS